MIAILIVGYKSKNDLKECLGSIFKSTYKKFRVFFIDNCPDGSIEFIKAKFPKVTIVPNNKNLGYAVGNNLLIKEAIKHKADYVFILNPDTIIDKDCLKYFLKQANAKTILQPLLLINRHGKNTNLINTTGGSLNFLGFSYCSDYKQDKSTVFQHDIPIASGASVFIPINILKKIGLYDENFFMYHEDVDLFWRARLNNYTIKLIPEALVWHKYSFSRNKNKFFYVERNRLLFLYKNFNLKYLLLIFPIFLLNEILMIFYSLFDGWIIQKLKSYLSAVKLLSKESKLRKNNLTKVGQSQHKLKKYIKASISFSEISNPLFYPYNLILRFYWFLISFLI